MIKIKISVVSRVETKAEVVSQLFARSSTSCDLVAKFPPKWRSAARRRQRSLSGNSTLVISEFVRAKTGQICIAFDCDGLAFDRVSEILSILRIDNFCSIYDNGELDANSMDLGSQLHKFCYSILPKLDFQIRFNTELWRVDCSPILLNSYRRLITASVFWTP